MGLPCAHKIEDQCRQGDSVHLDDVHRQWFFNPYMEIVDQGLTLDPLPIRPKGRPQARTVWHYLSSQPAQTSHTSRLSSGEGAREEDKEGNMVMLVVMAMLVVLVIAMLVVVVVVVVVAMVLVRQGSSRSRHCRGQEHRGYRGQGQRHGQERRRDWRQDWNCHISGRLNIFQNPVRVHTVFLGRKKGGMEGDWGKEGGKGSGAWKVLRAVQN